MNAIFGEISRCLEDFVHGYIIPHCLVWSTIRLALTELQHSGAVSAWP
jgi:hypothetical protein